MVKGTILNNIHASQVLTDPPHTFNAEFEGKSGSKSLVKH
jgi:hypothetical protein